jgi:PAS domain S-box-containing protein
MDIKTMYLVVAIGYLIFGLVLFLFQRGEEPTRRIPYWAGAKLIQALGLFLMAEREVIPDLLSVALANSLLLCGYAYEAFAMVWVSGRTLSRRFHLSMAAAIILVSFVFLWLPPVPRLVIASCFLAVIFGMAGWALFNFRGKKTLLSAYLGWSMGGAALVMAARAIWALFDAQSVTLFSASLVQQIGALCFYYLLLTSGFGILLLAKQTADLELRAVLNEQSAIWETLPTGLCILRERVVVRCNPAMEAMFGFVPGSLPGQSVRSSYLSEADYEAYNHQIYTLLRKNQVFEGEIPFRRRNGEQFWAKVQGRAIFPERDQAHAVFSITDVTERVQMEAALRLSEGKFKTILETSPDGIATTTLDGTLQFATAKLAALFGYETIDELVGLRAFDLIHPDDRERLQALLSELFKGHLTGAAEARLLRRDGSSFCGELNANLLLDAAQQPVGILCVARNITERKKAEAELRESEERFRSLLDSQESNILVLDFDGVHHYVNQVGVASIASSGTAKDILGKRLHDLYPPQVADWQLEQIRRVITTGQGFSGDFQDGGNHPIRWWHLNLQPIRNASGQVVQVMVNSLDITERKRIENEIRLLNTELEQRVQARTRELHEAQEKLVRQEKLAILGQLAGSVGHELRNPLGVINSALYYLRLIQPKAERQVLEYLSMIEAETHLADKIINDLLDFSRSTAVDLESVAVSQLVEATLKRFPLPENIRVSLNLPADLPKAQVDPRQLTQVLGNLVLNAGQAMPQGGQVAISAERRTEISVEQPAGTDPRLSMSPLSRNWLLISVRDTGSGIPPENLEKLFEPLFTTKPKGIGLGLAVSKKLVEANGGKIEVQSEPGQGAVFNVYLPVDEAQHA